MFICKFYFKKKISRYIDNDLSDTEKKQAEKHISGCPECAERLKDYREFSIAFKASQVAPVPGYLWERLKNRINEKEITSPVPAVNNLFPLFQPLNISLALVTIAFVILLFNQVLFIKAIRKVGENKSAANGFEKYQLADRLLFDEENIKKITEDILESALSGSIFEIEKNEEPGVIENKMIYNLTKGGKRLC